MIKVLHSHLNGYCSSSDEFKKYLSFLKENGYVYSYSVSPASDMTNYLQWSIDYSPYGEFTSQDIDELFDL